jgi:glutamate-1-semialdehyde 2,1-aminomutase
MSSTLETKSYDFYAGLKDRATEIETRYRELTPASGHLALKAKEVFPGGSTRDAVVRRPYGPYVTEGRGATLVDVDGRELIDLWFNASSLALGHADPRVTSAVGRQLSRGTAFFASTESEIDLARELCARLPSAERVLFTNSGSEAVMLAVRLARAFSGRQVLAKFEGSYHGSYDDVSWSVWPAADKVGPADRPHHVPASAGLTSAAERVMVLPFNDLKTSTVRIEEQADQIAAIIVEPLTNRMGLTFPAPGFLAGLRALCDRHGIVLIFDEVLAFRAGYHGAQGLVGVVPDLTTLGKIVGGGLPVGAVAGRAAVMASAEPHRAGRVTHFGTFNANPMTMVAGKATLDALTPAVFEELNASGERLRAGLRTICAGLPFQITGTGSLFKITATPHALVDYRSTLTADFKWQEVASLEFLNEGFLIDTQLRGCIATATTGKQIDTFLGAFQRIVYPGA